jgi:hypothetical protein
LKGTSPGLPLTEDARKRPAGLRGSQMIQILDAISISFFVYIKIIQARALRDAPFFRNFLLCYNRHARGSAGVAELVDARDLKFSRKKN